jgi:hypothetical protein
VTERQIFGFSGVLEGGADGFRLIEHAVGLGRGPRVCYLPTAVGDDPEAVQQLRDATDARLPGIELSVLTLFVQPSVPDVRAHLRTQDVIRAARGRDRAGRRRSLVGGPGRAPADPGPDAGT